MATWCDSLIVYLLAFALSWGAICPPGWKRWQESCYALYFDRLRWLQASQFCTSKGSYLVVPNSRAENDFVWGMMLERALPMSQLETGAWMGCIFVTSSFKCYGDSETMNIINWVPDLRGTPQNDTCARYPKDGNGKWEAGKCTHKRHFACEMPTTPRLYCATADANGRFKGLAP